MRKQTVIRSSVSMLLIAAGYVAICLRTYYTGPAIRADPRIPEPVVRAMVEAEKEHNFLEPEPFTWGGALHHLMHPWEPDVREVEMWWLGEPIPLPSGELHPKADRGTAWIEVEGVGGLRGDITYGLDGIENVRITPPHEP